MPNDFDFDFDDVEFDDQAQGVDVNEAAPPDVDPDKDASAKEGSEKDEVSQGDGSKDLGDGKDKSEEEDPSDFKEEEEEEQEPEQEEETPEQAKESEKKFVSNGIAYLNGESEYGLDEKEISTFDDFVHAIEDRAVQKATAEGADIREVIKQEIKEEYGLNELDMESYKSRKYGVDAKEIRSLDNILEETEKEYNTGGSKENKSKNILLIATRKILEEGMREDSAMKLARLEVEEVESDSSKYKKLLSGSQKAIAKLVSAKKRTMEAVAERNRKAFEASKTKRDKEISSFLDTGTIGDLKIRKADLPKIKRAMLVKDQDLKLPSGDVIKTTLAKKLFNEQPAESHLKMIVELILGNGLEKEKEIEDSRSKAVRKGTFASYLNKKSDKTHFESSQAEVIESDDDVIDLEF